MKITITEIEANAEELKASNSIADGLSNTLRRLFWNTGTTYSSYSNNTEDNENDTD